MRGTVSRRGKSSWRIKFDLGRDANGKRQFQRVTVRGMKADAEAKLTEMLSAVGKGEFVKPVKVTVAEWVSQRLDAWVAAREIGGSTEQGYRRVLNHYIVPHLGARTIQSLKPLCIERWHATLRGEGLSARTIACSARRCARG